MVRVADLVGIPLERVLDLAPSQVSGAVNVALRRALDVAVVTLPTEAASSDNFDTLSQRAWWSGYRHSALTAVTGGTGGVLGTLGLWIELPITTCLMLRSMSSIARQFGEDTRSIEVRLECLSLFGLGGPSEADDDMDASYLAVRASLTSLVKHASKYVAHTPSQEILTSIKNGTAPTLVKLLGKISQRFELAVSEKMLAQAIPLVGAVGGASVNVMFAQHFNAIARYHFGLRHLGRTRGEEAVRSIYEEGASGIRPRPPAPPRIPDFRYRNHEDAGAGGTKPR
jgi:hypothetical protein